MKYPPILPKVPHMVHGGDYNPDQWIAMKDVIWNEDMRLAKLAGINELSVGIFSWAALEPEEGVYDFTWLDEIMDKMAENGITAILATPSGARPAWMSRKYPEVLRVDEKRVKQLHGGRHNHCLSSKVYRTKVQEINTLLAERYKDHPALGGWHISNEFSGECHCSACQENFRTWLKEKYGTLDALNQAWWTSFWSHTYTDWSQVESPSSIGEQSVHAQKLDWKRFTTEQFVKWYQFEVEPLKRITPDIPCTTNLMGIYPGINYYRLAEVMDFACWDSYPQWESTLNDVETAQFFAFEHDLTRGLKDGKPFFLMESCPSATNWRPYARLHRPGVHFLQSMQAVAHGADSVQYFQFRKSRGAFEKFHGAVVDHQGGTEPREFQDVKAMGQLLERIDAVTQSDVHAQVALVFDWENRWAIDDAQGPRNKGMHYVEQVQAHYRALWRMGISVDIVDEECDISGYKLVIAPMLYLLREGFEEKLKAFVDQGGTLIGTYHTGIVNDCDLTYLGGWPGAGLMEVFGVWNENIDALWDEERNTLQVGEASYETKDLCALIHPQGAQVLGTYGQDFYKGEAALTVNQYGKGQAYYIASFAEDSFYLDFYQKLAGELALTRALPQLPPEGVEACLRESDDTQYLFLQNFTGEKQAISLPEGYVDLEGNPAAEAALDLYDSQVFLRNKA